MKLLRTIRLDPSDSLVFERAAVPGEWAVSGGFVFWSTEPELLTGKARVAFRSGLLGIDSLGWSTLAVVTAVGDDERRAAEEALALKLVSHFGAPSLAQARSAAQQEFAFAAELAEPPVGTLVAVHRSVEQGEVRERFRTLLPTGDEKHNRVFHFEMVEDDPEERLDLMSLKART